MATTYIGLAIADGMFPESAMVSRLPLNIEEASSLIGSNIVSCCNPSHKLTLEALKTKYGIEVPIPEKAQFVKLVKDDSIIVLSARFPRRLNEGEVWTEEDVEKAEFKFSIWHVMDAR